MAVAELEESWEQGVVVRRALGTAIAVLLVAAVVASFLVDAEPRLDLDASPAAMQRAVSAVRDAATLKTDGTVSVEAGGNTFGFRVRSTTDNERKLSEILMDFETDQPMPFPKNLEMVGTATHVFVRQPSGGGWLGASSADINAAAAQFGADQNAFLAYLDALAGDASPGPTDRIRGVDAQRFDVKVDVSRLPAMTGQQKDAAAQLAASGLPELPGSIWLDEDGRLRRLVLTIEAGGAKSVSKVDYYDYGKPVSIEEPPTAEVEMLESVQALFGRLGMPFQLPQN